MEVCKISGPFEGESDPYIRFFVDFDGGFYDWVAITSFMFDDMSGRELMSYINKKALSQRQFWCG